MTQHEALALLKMGHNVFLTGEPGAGKSHTVNAFVGYLRSHGIDVAVTASTGIAATHIGGMTIHSWSGIGISKSLTSRDLAEMAGRDKLVRRMKSTRVLIIDEISMLDGSTLDLVNAVCKAIRASSLPFGGIQVVFVGDFFQLPPVGRDGDMVQFAFDAAAWRDAAPTTCYLSEQHRQEDKAFLRILSALRTGDVTDEHREQLSERYALHAEDMTKLFAHNADVDRINLNELAKLPGKPVTFTMRRHGAKPLVEQIMRGCLSPEHLVLKLGAKVMFTKNSPEQGFVNGTIGVVTAFDKDTGLPIVELRSGRTVTVEAMDWSIVVDGSPLASIVQLPLRLAWAITVHKSQGMSLDAAYVDLSGAFAYGQGYVALSRVRTLDGLHLGGLNERALQVDPTVIARDAEFRDASQAAQDELAAMSEDEIATANVRMIIAAGGTVAGGVAPTAPKKKNTGERYTETFAVLASGKTIAEAALERELTPRTIIGHLEKLKSSGKLRIADIVHIFEGDAGQLAEIHAAIAKLGFEKMKPVYEYLKEKYPYDTLRIANLFYPQIK